MSDKIRVAIVGIGNNASALVQGAYFYGEEESPGVMHADIGGFSPADLEFVAAFDINEAKVGQDLSQAIFAYPNNTRQFAEVPYQHVPVRSVPVMDGVGPSLRELIIPTGDAPLSAEEAERVLRDAGAEVLVNFLPVGAEDATRWWTERALGAGCAFVNCIPVFIANDEGWRARFEEAQLPLVGDDIKGQVGATILHRTLAKLMTDRGVQLDRTYQLNFGGNTDFYNMLDRHRLASKKISKTGAVQDVLEEPLDDYSIHVSPSDHVSWLEDRKWAHVRLEGTTWGGAPLTIEAKLEVWDSPNAAGVATDAIRAAGAALRAGIGGVLDDVSAYLMKSPPNHASSDEQTRRQLDRFLEEL